MGRLVTGGLLTEKPGHFLVVYTKLGYEFNQLFSKLGSCFAEVQILL